MTGAHINLGFSRIAVFTLFYLFILWFGINLMFLVL